jgi:hypothetical protein
MRWAVHVGRMGELGNVYKTFSENMIGRNNSEDLGVEGRIMLVWTLGKEC